MLGITPLVSKSERRLMGIRYSSLLRRRAILSLAVSMSRMVSPSFSRKRRRLCPPVTASPSLGYFFLRTSYLGQYGKELAILPNYVNKSIPLLEIGSNESNQATDCLGQRR